MLQASKHQNTLQTIIKGEEGNANQGKAKKINENGIPQRK
jgi:hypothetical protein